MSDPAQTIAFIGLGVMGYPMAINLRKKLPSTTTLLICDVAASALERFKSEMVDEGPVEIVRDGKEAIERTDTIITMLPNSPAVKAVYLDSTTGLIPTYLSQFASDTKTVEGNRKLLIECGTIESATILSVAAAIPEEWRERLVFVDAPVSGGPMGAVDGTLTFMVGAKEIVDFEGAKNVLKYMGKENAIFHCGDVGAGTAFKIINNYLSAITSLAASEALNIGAKAGLNLSLLTDVINVSGGQCWVTSKSNPVPGIQADVPSSRNYEGGFRIELCEKVLRMGGELARGVGARTVLDGPTLEAFGEAMNDERYKGKDARVVYKWLNESEVEPQKNA